MEGSINQTGIFDLDISIVRLKQKMHRECTYVLSEVILAVPYLRGVENGQRRQQLVPGTSQHLTE